MDEFGFGSVEPGEGRQFRQKYYSNGSNSVVDDKGEAFYAIEGQGKGFYIWARTHLNHNDEGKDDPLKLYNWKEKWVFDNLETDDVAKGAQIEYGHNTRRS